MPYSSHFQCKTNLKTPHDQPTTNYIEALALCLLLIFDHRLRKNSGQHFLKSKVHLKISALNTQNVALVRGKKERDESRPL